MAQGVSEESCQAAYDEAYAAAEHLPKNQRVAHSARDRKKMPKAVQIPRLDEGADFRRAGERKIHGASLRSWQAVL